jgi:pseudouridine kinase
MDRIDGFDRVTVFGGATIDRIGRTAAPPVPGASNPGSVEALPGGVGLNIASILARLGLKTSLAAIVGRDGDGDAILEAALRAGVNTRSIVQSPSSATATYQAAFDNEGGLIVGIAAMDIYRELTPAALATSLVAARNDGAWVIDANLPDVTLAFLAEEAASAGRPVFAVSVSPAKAVHLAPILPRLAVIFANRKEAAAILGRPIEHKTPVAELADALVGKGVFGAVVTDGEAPLAVAGDGAPRSFAPLRAEVKRVNGAGDSLSAGTIFGLAGGRPLAEAIRIGIGAAALTLEAGSVLAAPFTVETLHDRSMGRRPVA